jgi:hypothetical protein
MTRVIQMLFGLIAYVCVATVITLALGLGYLWQTDQLNDEKVFRIVALLQDVELQQPSETRERSSDEVPQEEASPEDVGRHQQLQDRNFEVKLLALQRGRQEYDHRLQELKVQTDRYDRLAQEWQSRLRQQEELASQENLAKVVSQLEQVSSNQGKALMMLWIDEGRMDDAILLMSKMSENKLARILKEFESPEELDKLHQIHQRIMGSTKTPKLQEALDELKSSESAP